jgi:hypothetical protein
MNAGKPVAAFSGRLKGNWLTSLRVVRPFFVFVMRFESGPSAGRFRNQRVLQSTPANQPATQLETRNRIVGASLSRCQPAESSLGSIRRRQPIARRAESQVIAAIRDRASQQPFRLAARPCSDERLRNSNRWEPSVKEMGRKLVNCQWSQLQFRKSLKIIRSHATRPSPATPTQSPTVSEPLTVNNDRRVVGVLMDSWNLRLLRVGSGG